MGNSNNKMPIVELPHEHFIRDFLLVGQMRLDEDDTDYADIMIAFLAQYEMFITFIEKYRYF